MHGLRKAWKERKDETEGSDFHGTNVVVHGVRQRLRSAAGSGEGDGAESVIAGATPQSIRLRRRRFMGFSPE
jgi:hypothetical protein